MSWTRLIMWNRSGSPAEPKMEELMALELNLAAV